VDTCGFKSYRLMCNACQSVIVGVVDPYDDSVLISG
jgi:hypothetical protein